MIKIQDKVEKFYLQRTLATAPAVLKLVLEFTGEDKRNQLRSQTTSNLNEPLLLPSSIRFDQKLGLLVFDAQPKAKEVTFAEDGNFVEEE